MDARTRRSTCVLTPGVDKLGNGVSLAAFHSNLLEHMYLLGCLIIQRLSRLDRHVGSTAPV
jgi:hypothetical protein